MSLWWLGRLVFYDVCGFDGKFPLTLLAFTLSYV